MSSFELDPANPRSAEAMARGDAVEALLQVDAFPLWNHEINKNYYLLVLRVVCRAHFAMIFQLE